MILKEYILFELGFQLSGFHLIFSWMQFFKELEDENQKLISSNSERLSRIQEQGDSNHKREIESIKKKLKNVSIVYRI